MKDWEKGFDQIAQAGYSYGYASYIDTTGEKFFLVDAIKGDGPRIAVAKPTMNEAVQELMRVPANQTIQGGDHLSDGTTHVLDLVMEISGVKKKIPGQLLLQICHGRQSLIVVF
jgi:hypothetical protein